MNAILILNAEREYYAIETESFVEHLPESDKIPFGWLYKSRRILFSHDTEINLIQTVFEYNNINFKRNPYHRIVEYIISKEMYFYLKLKMVDDHLILKTP